MQIVANLEFVTGFAIDLQTRKPNISPRVTECHERIAEQLDSLFGDGGKIPGWMTYGKTVLCLKDSEKGNAVDNYRPISCLPLMWKLLTGILANGMYEFLDNIYSQYFP